MLTPCQVKALYEQGNNITHILCKEKGLEQNTDEIIEIAYDLQTGSYIAAMDDMEIAKHKENYTTEIANTIRSLCTPKSILEAGVGEATTLSGVLQKLPPSVMGYGFDLSWSRIAYAKQWLKSKGVENTILCTGNLFSIPFADNSIDIVYTSHSIEPNGGNEGPILKELFRVARKFLVLLEPGYELADEQAKKRMDLHKYCKGLERIASSLGYDILKHELFPFTSNPLNPTAITIIKKTTNSASSSHVFVCPKFMVPLEEIGGMFYSPEALAVYPILGGIPCLRIENGIFASKYKEVLLRVD